MPGYRVTALYYRFSSLMETDSFETAEPFAGEIGDFDYSLHSGLLTAFPRREFRDREDAKKALEAHLHDWEQSSFLGPAGHRIRFTYDRSDVEEVDPSREAVTIFPEPIVVHAMALSPVIRRDNRSYPSPDTGFRATPVTDRLIERLRRVRDREAELPAVAYLVLDTLEHEFGGATGRRGTAAKAIAVDEAVLDRLGELSSRADPEIGRKAAGVPAPLMGTELRWMEQVVVRLIRRVGELAASVPLSPISMADFPPLLLARP